MKSLILAIAILLAFVPVAFACPPVAVQSFGVQQFGLVAQSHCNAVAVQSFAVQPFGAVAYSSPVVVQQFVPFAVQNHHVAAFNVRQFNVHSARVNQRSVNIQSQRSGAGILGGVRARLQGILGGGGNSVRSRAVNIQSFQGGY